MIFAFLLITLLRTIIVMVNSPLDHHFFFASRFSTFRNAEYVQIKGWEGSKRKGKQEEDSNISGE